MAVPYSASPVDVALHAVHGFAIKLYAVAEHFGRARAASALYTELAGLSDQELDHLGMRRDEIARKVYSKVYSAK